MSFDVPINNDNMFEMNEDFSLTIIVRSLPDGVSRDKAGPATVIILDDDGENVYCLCQLVTVSIIMLSISTSRPHVLCHVVPKTGAPH